MGQETREMNWRAARRQAVKQARERETTCQRSGFGRNVITSSIIIQPDRCSRRSSANRHFALLRLRVRAAAQITPLRRRRHRHSRSPALGTDYDGFTHGSFARFFNSANARPIARRHVHAAPLMYLGHLPASFQRWSDLRRFAGSLLGPTARQRSPRPPCAGRKTSA